MFSQYSRRNQEGGRDYKHNKPDFPFNFPFPGAFLAHCHSTTSRFRDFLNFEQKKIRLQVFKRALAKLWAYWNPWQSSHCPERRQDFTFGTLCLGADSRVPEGLWIQDFISAGISSQPPKGCLHESVVLTSPHSIQKNRKNKQRIWNSLRLLYSLPVERLFFHPGFVTKASGAPPRTRRSPCSPGPCRVDPQRVEKVDAVGGSCQMETLTCSSAIVTQSGNPRL